MGKVILGILVSWSLFCGAQEFTPISPAPVSEKRSSACLPATELARETQDFFWLSSSSEVRALESCNPSDLSYKVMKAVSFLRNLPPVESAADDFNPKTLGKEPFEFFRSHIRQIRFDGESSPMCSVTWMSGKPQFGTVAAVYSRDPSRAMHVCEFAGKFDLLEILSTLVHEARHIDGFPHVHCERGTYRRFEGRGAAGRYCDVSYDERGSYGVETEFYVDLMRAPTVSQPLRQAAKASALTSLFERFNELPFDLQDGALVQDQNGFLYFFDGRNYRKFWQGDATDVLVSRNSQVMMYRPSRGQVSGFDLALNPAIAVGGMVETFENLLSPRQQKDLVDVYYGPAYSCFLFRHSLECMDRSMVPLEIPLRDFQPQAFVAIDGSSLMKLSAPAILDDSGTLRMLPDDFTQLQKSGEEDFEVVGNPHHLKKIAPWMYDGGKALMVDIDGHLQFFSETTGEVSSVPSPDEDVLFRSVLSPVVWSRKIQDL